MIVDVVKNAPLLASLCLPLEGYDDPDGQAAYRAAVEFGGVFAGFSAKLDLSSLIVAAAAYVTGRASGASKEGPAKGGRTRARPPAQTSRPRT